MMHRNLSIVERFLIHVSNEHIIRFNLDIKIINNVFQCENIQIIKFIAFFDVCLQYLNLTFDFLYFNCLSKLV